MPVDNEDLLRIQSLLDKAKAHASGGKSVEVHGPMILDNGKTTQATIYVHDNREVPSCRNIGVVVQGDIGGKTVFVTTDAGRDLQGAFDYIHWQRALKTQEKVKDLTLVWD